MSGLEVIGVIASTFQLAEVGIKLSVKLCSFYRQIKDADHSAQRLASDVSLTCSILHQLGKILEQDSQTKLCSQQAFLTAQEVLGECEKIFKQIEEAIQKKDPGSGKSRWERGTRRFAIVVLGPDLDVLKSHLDKLKSTMLLMLNVIMYAREINRTSDYSSLETQRQLIETLLQEKAEVEAKLNRLANVTDTRSGCDGEHILSSSTPVTQPSMALLPQLPRDNEIDKYYDLVKSLLSEIDVHRGDLQQDRHWRIRDGVVNVHKAELAIFQMSHGKAAIQAFDCPYFSISIRDMYSSSNSKPSSQETYQPYTPREQFDRDYPVQLRNHAGMNSLDRPRSMISTDDENFHVFREDKILTSPYANSRRESPGPRDTSRLREGNDRAPLVSPHESDDSCNSFSDSHRWWRRRRESIRDSNDELDNENGEHCVAAGLGRAPLGGGHSDLSDYDHRRPHRRRITRLGRHSQRASRSRERDSCSDAYTTDDGDLHKNRREPSAADSGKKHSNTDTSSAKSSHRRHRDYSLPRLEDNPTDGSHHFLSGNDDEYAKNIVPIGPPTTRDHEALPKGIVKRPRPNFPEVAGPVREKREVIRHEYHHCGDILGDEASADGDNENDDGNECGPMEADSPFLAQKEHDVSNSKRVPTASLEENPRKSMAWGTLEDLVLSWTTLPRGMIQLREP